MEYERFIIELEKEHALIEQAFKKLELIIKSGNISNAADVLEIIEQFKTLLVKHLKKEDTLFYPDMRKKAVELKQDALLPALDVFIENMKNISQKVFDFFSRYDTEKAILGNGKDFINGIAEVKDALIKRIYSEEKTLYLIYKAYHHL